MLWVRSRFLHPKPTETTETTDLESPQHLSERSERSELNFRLQMRSRFVPLVEVELLTDRVHTVCETHGP